MNLREKIVFINTLISNVKRDIMSKVEDMPEEWDGHELRRYIADKFDDANLWKRMSMQRRRAYNNTVIVKNL